MKIWNINEDNISHIANYRRTINLEKFIALGKKYNISLDILKNYLLSSYWLENILIEKCISIEQLEDMTDLNWKTVFNNKTSIEDITTEYIYHIINTLDVDIDELYIKSKRIN